MALNDIQFVNNVFLFLLNNHFQLPIPPGVLRGPFCLPSICLFVYPVSHQRALRMQLLPNLYGLIMCQHFGHAGTSMLIIAEASQKQFVLLTPKLQNLQSEQERLHTGGKYFLFFCSAFIILGPAARRKR